MADKFESKHGRIMEEAAFDMEDVVVAMVGSKPTKFIVHSDILRKSSKFLDTAMKPEWSGPPDSCRVINLIGEDPYDFKIYLHWLYCKTLPTVVMQDGNNDPVEYETLSKCYVMGERLMDIGFKIAVINALFEARTIQPFQTPRNPGPDPIKIIYEGTPEGSPARRYFADVWATHATQQWMSLLDSMPPAFTIDLSKALVARKTKKATMICADYHES